jgi:hypothetical protein
MDRNMDTNKRRKKLLLIAPFAILGILVFVSLGGWMVKTLWNWLLPTIFGLPQVTFWQALGLLVLSRILFSGLPIGGRGRGGFRRHRDGRCDSMTPEEREQFRQRMRERFGFGPDRDESPSPES